MAFRPVRTTTTNAQDQTTSSTSRADNTTTTQPTTTSAQPTASQESRESGDLLFAHFAQILQRDPEIEAPILRQLVEELNQFREVAVEPDVEVLSGAVDPSVAQRSPTVIERINALVRRRDPKVTLDRMDDLELQYASVPSGERQLLALMQKLTIALNPESVFSIAHLGAHDYVQIDAYLRSDFYRSIRSNFTREIYLPQWSDADRTRYPISAVYIIVQSTRGMRHHAQQLVELLSRIADSRELLPGAILFEHIITITTLIRNVTSRQAAVHAQLFPQAFRGHDQPRLAEVLAKYGVYFQDIHEADTYATAAVAEAYDVLNRLNHQHMEQLQQLHDQAVFVTTAEERRPAATPVQQSADAHMSSTPSLHESFLQEFVEQPGPSHRLNPWEQAIAPVAQHAGTRPHDRPPSQQSFQASRAPSRAPVPARPPSRAVQVRSPSPASIRSATPPTLREYVQQREPLYIPTQEPATGIPRCYFCPQNHYSSECERVPNLSRRLMIHANRGRCFKCGELHDEALCTKKVKCRACKSTNHCTPFCKRNTHVIVDFPEHEFYDRLEAAMRHAKGVRETKQRRSAGNMDNKKWWP